MSSNKINFCVIKVSESKKKSGEDLNESKTYSRKSDSNLFSHSRVILNRSFFGEKYKQYLTFSVEISTNTLITQYSKHLWSDEQEHTHKRIKSLHDSGKGYRTIAKLLNAEGS